MSIRRRGDRYQVRVRLPAGQRIERTLPAGARLEDARALEAEIFRRRIDYAVGRQPDRLIDEALLRWEPEARALKSWHKDLRFRFAEVRRYTAGRRLDDLPAVADEIKEAKLAEHRKPATINRLLAVLRRAGNLAVRWGWTDKPLGQRVGLLGGETQRHTYLSVAQVRALAKACELREVGDLVLFAALTGLRRSEILRLEPQNIQEGVVLLDAVTKSGRPRAVPMPPRAARIAAKRVPWTVGVRTLRRVFEAARDAAGLPGVRFHDLRHTYASWLVQGGASMASVRDLLGHSSLAVTSRYAHLSRPDLVAAVANLGGSLGSGKPRR